MCCFFRQTPLTDLVNNLIFIIMKCKSIEILSQPIKYRIDWQNLSECKAMSNGVMHRTVKYVRSFSLCYTNISSMYEKSEFKRVLGYSSSSHLKLSLLLEWAKNAVMYDTEDKEIAKKFLSKCLSTMVVFGRIFFDNCFYTMSLQDIDWKQKEIDSVKSRFPDAPSSFFQNPRVKDGDRIWNVDDLHLVDGKIDIVYKKTDMIDNHQFEIPMSLFYTSECLELPDINYTDELENNLVIIKGNEGSFVPMWEDAKLKPEYNDELFFKESLSSFLIGEADKLFQSSNVFQEVC